MISEKRNIKLCFLAHVELGADGSVSSLLLSSFAIGLGSRKPVLVIMAALAS